jgi:hypothetical protein
MTTDNAKPTVITAAEFVSGLSCPAQTQLF